MGIKYITQAKTLGDRIRNRRLELGLLQKDIAVVFKVSEDCVTNWENNRNEPLIHHMPNVIRLVGYNPNSLDAGTVGQRLKQYRLLHGLSHKKMGALIGVDASTIGSWENNEHRPNKKAFTKLKRILGTSA